MIIQISIFRIPFASCMRLRTSLAVRHARQDAQQFIQNIGPGQRRVAGRIIGWRNLNQIAAHDVQPLERTDQFHRLRRGQPANLGRAGAGRIGRIKAVDVIGDIDRRIADIAPDFRTQWRKTALPQFMRRKLLKPPTGRLGEIFRRIAGAAQTDLIGLVGLISPSS